ncbi:phage terminase large subunit [Gilliamella apicola]|uniref:Terminase large subunit gp17-like C-terminal domain-containing protein n=1 Tax=Gilliamella apicola TaxID=1196095 RepID=A0A242NMV7_9GAMM|nr:phage terminase large subunit [Gilliamella apicola]OTP81693.1 hypothetical protein B5S40_10160 [Gilliamella apicola]OTP85234.1 hypothetical protein B5S44_06175 [Gilliamella apicola]OTQ01623.1 hypothetical protein B6D08_00020 [Gilliamella apicola]OTQ11301.1 hypothetical protein B6C91_02915 [Gilliamella apicola]OTQ16407.1 hypothetical protein B6D11_03770 [Gilliamella apicola]
MLTVNQIAELRTDLLAFSKHMFKARHNYDFVVNWHHELICEYLERVIIGDIKRLIINIPPRYSKTELAVVNFIAWCMGNFPDCEFIHASYSKKLAANNTYQARALMLHESYSEIFGTPHICHDSNAKDEFKTVEGGCVYAAGAEGTITGYGAGKMRQGFGGAIIIDDPHKASEATSDTMRQNVIDWFSTTIESRTNSPDTPIIVIMQRLHEHDLAGWLLSGGNEEEWTHLNIPALNDNDEPLWEFKHTYDDLRRLEKANPYVFAGQYMQRPAPLGGGIFKTEWFKLYRMLPDLKFTIITVDTAQKTKERNDYSVFALWGQGIDGNAYLIDILRGKWESPDLIKMATRFWCKHREKFKPRSMNVEDKVSGTTLVQTLSKTADPVIPIIAIQRNTDKITRALDVAPFIESGRVYLPEQADWLSDFITEHAQFPNGAHDDQVDTTSDGLNAIFGKQITTIWDVL